MDYETQYLRILMELRNKMKFAKENNSLDQNRTGINTVTLFGQTLSAKVNWNHFPVLTTKYVYLHGVITELIWFLRGDGNIKFLIDNNVNIWTANAYAHNKKKDGFPDIPEKYYAYKIKSDKNFAERFGDLDGGYGQMWRNFNGVDQIKRCLDLLKTNPESRENLVSAWNPPDIPGMALPPCHFAFQVHVKSNKISMSMYQRSADWFLGVPFNLTSYSLLLLLFAKYTGYKPEGIYMHFGDAHLYENHYEQAEKQIARGLFIREAPSIQIKDKALEGDLRNIEIGDIKIEDYNHLGKIKAKMAV